MLFVVFWTVCQEAELLPFTVIFDNENAGAVLAVVLAVLALAFDLFPKLSTATIEIWILPVATEAGAAKVTVAAFAVAVTVESTPL